MTQLHYLDPEDLLQQDETSGLKPLLSLPHHFAENHRVLALLAQNKLSFRYDRMSDDDILAERAKLTVEAGGSTSTSSSTSGRRKGEVEDYELGDSDLLLEDENEVV